MGSHKDNMESGPHTEREEGKPTHQPPTHINQPPYTHKEAKMTDCMGTAGKSMSVCCDVCMWMGNGCETYRRVCMCGCVCRATNSPLWTQTQRERERDRGERSVISHNVQQRPTDHRPPSRSVHSVGQSGRCLLQRESAPHDQTGNILNEREAMGAWHGCADVHYTGMHMYT